LTSSAARSNGDIWGIQRYYYGGTDGTAVVRTAWAVKAGAATSSSSNLHSCDDRVSLAYQ
jgi:putative aminopeptidase FrvX